MTREDRAIQILRVKRRRGDRVIGRMAMIGFCECLEEEVGDLARESVTSVPAVIFEKCVKR